MNYKYNLLPSPDDKRDYFLRNAYKVQEIPETLDLRMMMLPIRNQGSQGACVAMSAAAMKEYQENRIRYLSPQFIYNMRIDPQEGMTMRDLLRILTYYGICIEELCPYGSSLTSDAAKENALYYRIKGYGRIYDIYELKVTLALQGPCVMAVPVYNEDYRIWHQVDNQPMLGGHAMCIVGYNAEGFIIRNSWGTEWGDQGYCILPYEDFGDVWEIWGTVDAETVIPEPPVKKKCWLISWIKKISGINNVII